MCTFSRHWRGVFKASLLISCEVQLSRGRNLFDVFFIEPQRLSEGKQGIGGSRRDFGGIQEKTEGLAREAFVVIKVGLDL